MKVKSIRLVLRKDGFFHYNGSKIKAVYPRSGWAVMLFLEESPIDVDFKEPVLVLTCDQLKEINDKMKESDQKTRALIGHGWLHGPRPCPDPTPKLHELM